MDETFQLTSAADGQSIQGYIWRTSGEPQSVLVIAHGWAEHALRYSRFAEALNDRGIEAWAIDHRGHGRSAVPGSLGDFGEAGWNGLVSDLGQLIDRVRGEQPGLKLTLFAHSMGSMAAQHYCVNSSGSIDALVLSGSSAVEVPEKREGSGGQRREKRRTKTEDPSKARLGVLNAAFDPPRTPYDWLSRDEAEVDLYIADPLCGFEGFTASRTEMRGSWADLADPEMLARISADLPVLLVAGDEDPINRRLEGLRLLETRWRNAGVQRIDTLYYQGGRHEMLNELNRDEVTADIIDWLYDVCSLAV
jgi:alpha-beta hydrolase superfamily lysophospholipase